MSFVLDPHQTVAQNFSRVGAAELRTALDGARDVSRPAAERIHDARTRCKRVRALLRIVQPAFADFHREDRAVRDAAVLLSGARDGEVMMDTLAGLELEPTGYPSSELDWLREELRTPAGATRDDEAALAAFAAGIEQVYRRALGWRGYSLDWPKVAEGAADTYRRADRAMRKAAKSGAARDFHAWRKQVKYNWHHLALLRRFAPDRFRTARRAAKVLASLLGGHHDREVLHEHLHKMRKPRPAPGLGKLIRHRNAAAAAEALEQGAELYAASPDKWRDYIAIVVAGGGVDERSHPEDAHAAGD